jgi:cyclic beta-1,2-glucan synthetase
VIRIFISQKRLLQWQTSAHTIKLFGRQRNISTIWQRMIGAPILSLLVGTLFYLTNPTGFWINLPLIVLWFLSPQIAYWISLKLSHEKIKPLTISERNKLHSIARRTWLYFEHFVGPDEHWLPPDHFQEDPKGMVAHRTSPTNIGLMLLSTVAAHDFGYIGTLDYIYRITYTLDTLDEMEKYRGHLFNWYDTQDLETLAPKYISTVDSGNFAMSLIGLIHALEDILEETTCPETLFNGLTDTLQVFCEIIVSLEKIPSRKTIRAINEIIQTIQEEIFDKSTKSVQILDFLKDLEDNLLQLITNYLQNVLDSDVYIEPIAMQDLRNWSDAIFIHLRNIRQQINQLSPWLKTWANRPDWIETIENQEVKDFLNHWRDANLESLAIDQQPPFLDTGIKQVENLIRYLEEEELFDLENGHKNLLLEWFSDILVDIKKTHQNILDVLGQIHDLIDRINLYIERMEFGFLFDHQREVFYLGYLVDAGKLDRNHYDLLASEARTASLYAISMNAVPRSHWLHLNRPFTLINNIPTLLSWNGSMFEYLMPDLFTHTYPGTLLHQTNKGVVQAQIDYGKKKHVPWGISESSYYQFDQNDNYQYKGLGVPSLGRKRGLGDELVISPYASLMAISIDPGSVLNNIKFLESEGALGHFGFYESIDYTTARLPVGKNKAVIRSYMVHHHGMSLTALGNFLNEKNMIKRVHRDARVESSELLLQEHIPQIKVIEKQQDSLLADQEQDYEKISLTPWTVEDVPAKKNVHILSNGNFHFHVTETGSGYLSWENEIALTRWRPDKTLDNWGIWFYIQDLDTAEIWSIGSQPLVENEGSSKVIYSSHMVEFHRTFDEIHVVMQITISPNEDVCLHKIRVINQGSENRRFRIVSYGEVVLAPQATDWQHPAFNKLFIESKFDQDLNLLFFSRRKRSANEKELGLAHAVYCDMPGEVEFTTDRTTFIGRGLNSKNPLVISRNEPLSSIVGNTLDPIFALGKHITLNAEESVKMTFLTTPQIKFKNAKKTVQNYQSSFRISNEFSASKSTSEKQLRALNIDSNQLKTYQALLSNVLYPTPNLRGPSHDIKENELGQSGLWAFGISGDYPILLISIDSKDQIDEIQQIIKAHSYWRKSGQMIDVVFLNTKDTGYAHELNERIHQAINVMDSQTWVNRRGGLFVLTASQIDRLPLRLLNTVSSVYLDLKSMSIEQHLAKSKTVQPQLPQFNPPDPHQEFNTKEKLTRPDDLLVDNGIGGFSTNGKEYQIFLQKYPQHQQANGQVPPAPWVNVIANQDFGCLVSESGSGCTWAINSGENRLTPWMNDPVSDQSGEALYLRDELTGEIWSPTPNPAGAGIDYLVKHGQGYSTFESYQRGLKQKLRIFVDPIKPVKIIQMTLANRTDKNRRLTATYFAEWVLGARRDGIDTFIVPGFDDQSGTIFARNTYSAEFSHRVAFLSSDQPVHGLTTNREEFLGTPGSRQRPVGLLRVGLSNSVEPGVDPCAALQTHINLEPDEDITIAFVLGQGENEDHAKSLASFFSEKDNIEKSWVESNDNWDQILNTLQVDTPDEEMNLVLNRWLQYQNLSCRIWGRSGFFQSSGAYGYRDQLQDITAVLLAKPNIGRDHILRAARHQFEEGDVLHWWHPPSGNGVRTRITDDLLWLVYVTSEYIQKTGDKSILKEKIPFISGEPLEDAEEERYGTYETGKTGFSLFEHCRRALERGDTQGPHGLPLIGGGDWNDGMNRVGIKGKGESVWLAWFLYENHLRFAKLCEILEETDSAGKHRERAKELKERINNSAWEDDRFLRGYFDNGNPLGSKNSDECQIDSLPQSWSILTEGTDRERQLRAIDTVETHLVNKEGRFIQLFTPPFDKTKNDPGYIKGYPPGVRENGGQYTHAAIWAVWALAELGEGTKAHQQFGYLNPINHSRNIEEANTYCVEPYVVAADIYSQPPFIGRGGWTWYTGSSGWLYRLGTEALLGFKIYGDHFKIEPCIPSGWESYEMTYRKPDGPTYFIQVENANSVETGVFSITLDGKELDDLEIPILADKDEHHVIVVMG